MWCFEYISFTKALYFHSIEEAEAGGFECCSLVSSALCSVFRKLSDETRYCLKSDYHTTVTEPTRKTYAIGWHESHNRHWSPSDGWVGFVCSTDRWDNSCFKQWRNENMSDYASPSWCQKTKDSWFNFRFIQHLTKKRWYIDLNRKINYPWKWNFFIYLIFESTIINKVSIGFW